MTVRDKTVEGNLGLVHACAKRFKGRGIDYEDLYSAGCVGLIKSVDNFDCNRGVAFSTYAVPVIIGEIKQLFRESGAVKISRGLKELSIKAKAITADYINKNGTDMPISALAESLGVDIYKASEALNASQCVVSLTAYTEDSENEQMDIPVDSQEEQITEKLSLNSALKSLSEHDRQIINLRYFSHKTQTQTAQILNMTQVQVSRREKKILTQLREAIGT